MDIGGRFLKTGVAFGLAGMAVGIGMAASHDYTLGPAHAHINLVGWVALFLAGLYYRGAPSIAWNRLVAGHYYASTIGAALMGIGVAGARLDYPAGEPLAVVGSILTITGMAIFALVVFRPGKQPVAHSAPAGE